MRLKAVLKQRSHGSADVEIGLDGEERGGSTHVEVPRQGWEMARLPLCGYGRGLRHTGPAAKAQPFA
jgi:hypothetical protein